MFSQVEPGQVTGSLPQGQGGRITIEAETLQLLESGTVSASAFEGGTAGDIAIVSSGQVEIVGGDNGSSGVFAIGLGNGQAGNIELSAQQLRLASRGQISAATQTAVGGNVNLKLAESGVLRSASLISARAREGGSGGNVTIETGFLIGDTVSDGDIVASAINGSGGNIQISASGILGFAEGPSSLANGTNDIDASSQFGADGIVTIENPETDPSKGLVPLPENLSDLANQVAQSCGSANQLAANQFMVTGRGGLLPTPDVSLRARQLFADVGPVEPLQQPASSLVDNASPSPNLVVDSGIETPLLEAQEWTVNREGEIALIHSETTSNSRAALGHLYVSSCQRVSG
ncbi:MAG: hypothetical protein AAF703_23520 [Cyanobacteria bacterium P01_D01_bin.105]